MERYLGDIGDIIGKIAIWRAKYSTSPKARRRPLWLWASSYEYSDGGSGELSGDDLARFHGLVLPRSRGFGDEQPLERSRATSSVKALGRGRLVNQLSAMSKRLKLSDLAKVVAKKAATSASKGVVISEGSETTSGKRALDDGSKGKQVAQSPEPKKARIDIGASGASARPPVISRAEKILAGVVLPADKEKVDRLTFDQVVTKFLHVVGQGVILGSSLAVRSRDFAEGALNQKAVAESAEMEMVRAQNRAIELEGALAEEKAKGMKLAEDVDARGKVISKLEARVSDLEKSQSLTQGRIIAAFKESDDFLEAVRGSASSYFGDGFDFCKRQLAKQYPDLGVDLEDVEMDQELLAKEEAEAEKRAAEEEAAETGGQPFHVPNDISSWATRYIRRGRRLAMKISRNEWAFLNLQARSPRETLGECCSVSDSHLAVNKLTLPFMSFNTNLGGEESEQSLPSWISDHLGAKSYIDETTQSTSSPIPTSSSRMDTSSLTKESNVMSQADLDNLGTTYSFPPGVRLRIPGDGETILSARQGEICPAQLSPNAWRSVICSLVIWRIFKRHLSCGEFRCLYSLSPLPDSGWYYFKARPEKNLLRGSPEQRKGVENEVLFCLGGRVGVSPGRGCQREFTTSSQILGNTRHFAGGCSAFSTSGGDNTTSGDEGEFGTGEDSVEYLGVIRRGVGGAIRRALPGIPDETLLRWLGGRRGGLLEGQRNRAAPPPPKRFKSNRGAINARGRAAEAGTSSPAGDGGSQSMSDASVARRLLTGVIPESDKKEVDQLSENDLVAKSFHALGQVVVYASSLALRSQEHLHDIDFHMARADSAELELVKAQKRAIKAETRVAELNEEKSRPGTEVDDLKTTVAELTSKLAKAKELAIEDFKASEEFKAAVTDSAATYFGDGFEFLQEAASPPISPPRCRRGEYGDGPKFCRGGRGDEGRRRTFRRGALRIRLHCWWLENPFLWRTPSVRPRGARKTSPAPQPCWLEEPSTYNIQWARFRSEPTSLPHYSTFPKTKKSTVLLPIAIHDALSLLPSPPTKCLLLFPPPPSPSSPPPSSSSSAPRPPPPPSPTATARFSCGSSLSRLTYPFTGGDRPAHCGPPQFRLTCRDNAYAELTAADSVTYRVLQLNTTRKTLVLARSDLWNNTCPKKFLNSTLDPTAFSYGGETEDLCLVYGCSSLTNYTPYNQFNCVVSGANNSNAFLLGGAYNGKKLKAAQSTQAESKDISSPPLSKSLTTPRSNFTRSIPSYPSSKSDFGKASTYFGVQVFSYSELEEATNNFDPSRELGEGGFGTVYYEQFMNEVEILTRLRHDYLVTLFGCTSKRSRELLLVYEYIPNGTVADHLHGKRSNSGLLSWPVRLGIAIETADALAYLHRSDIIHRDVKTNNILLDNDFHVHLATSILNTTNATSLLRRVTSIALGSVRRMTTLVAELAFRCLQMERDMRPSMEEVLKALRGIKDDGSNLQVDVVDIVLEDDVGILKDNPPPMSPDSAATATSTEKWVSSSTAPNSIG
ncbi:protein kinase superfamily protein [Actinidia rufa]|uniref:Protein kinase superfamily protein n=1 Tax=Actinidia rufa TaxID=165716 RepID=A0A7J0E903_9ERIC|nr:protein kinase superfamily protein [Actinidia rufa]